MDEFKIIVEDEKTIDASTEIMNDFIKGEKGDKGDKGDSNILTIGTVEKGEEASASITGDSPNQVLNLVLPKGDKGDQGIQGIQGIQGEKGDTGEQGPKGDKGDIGETGYTPVKGTDYFTQEEIEQIKSDILADVSSFDLEVVTELPGENINAKAIYLILKDSEATNNIYNEYIYINGNWELIGSTEIDPSKLTVNLVENSYKLTLTQEVASGGTITVPSNYKVGLDRLDVYLNGEKLIKAVDNDNQGHYYEVGTQGNLSNTIKLSNDWSAKVGDVFEFTIRTNGQGVTEENLDIYSTEEQVIGKWIDGKTLYRKVINIGELIPNSRTDYSTGISNVKIKKFEAYFEALDNVFKLNHVNNYNKSSNEHESIALYTTLNGTSIRVENANVSATNLNCWVILEYTKISD